MVMPRSRSISMLSSSCSFMSRSGDGAGGLDQPVGQRGLAVVDMGDDREVADAVQRGVGHGGSGGRIGGLGGRPAVLLMGEIGQKGPKSKRRLPRRAAYRTPRPPSRYFTT